MNHKMEQDLKIKEYNYWTLEHVGHPIPVVGWLILRLKRDGEGLASINKEESKEFGEITEKLPKVIQEVTGAVNVYLCSFNEAVPKLHFHFIPRYAEEKRRTIEFFILQKEVKEGRVSSADDKEVSLIIEKLKNKL